MAGFFMVLNTNTYNREDGKCYIEMSSREMTSEEGFPIFFGVSLKLYNSLFQEYE